MLLETDRPCATPDCSNRARDYETSRKGKPEVHRSAFCSSCWRRKNIDSKRYRHHEDRWADTKGYIYIRTPEGYVLAEHRVVMERTLGRPLAQGESVHHRNGDPADNRPENLELWIGPVRRGVRAVDISCPHCGRSYLESP